MVNLIKKGICLALVLVFVLIALPALAAQPKYVFYFIGDGLGASQRQFSEFYLQEESKNSEAKLLMNTFNVVGMNTTYAADTLITDSAAAGTALASGVKTNKGVIGKDVNGKDVKTLIEAAVNPGYRNGHHHHHPVDPCHTCGFCGPQHFQKQ